MTVKTISIKIKCSGRGRSLQADHLSVIYSQNEFLSGIRNCLLLQLTYIQLEHQL